MSSSRASSCISPITPRVFTPSRAFLSPPTSLARVRISPRPLCTSSRRLLTCSKDASRRFSRLSCSFSSTVLRISSSLTSLLLRICSRRSSMLFLSFSDCSLLAVVSSLILRERLSERLSKDFLSSSRFCDASRFSCSFCLFR